MGLGDVVSPKRTSAVGSCDFKCDGLVVGGAWLVVSWCRIIIGGRLMLDADCY